VTLRTQRTRTNAGQSSLIASSSTSFSVSTDDPSLSVVMAPMPMLLLDFGGKRGFRPAAMRAAFPQRPLAAPVEKSDPPPPQPDPEHPASPVKAESSAAPAEPETHEEPRTPEPPAEAPANRIEMTIDSLPHHTLTEPIPIVIDQFGDKAFTASMRSLDISTNGNSSIGEALLLLKEQIEFVYGDLSRRTNMSTDQKTMLRMLHTYIAAQSAKPEWL